MNRNTLVRTLSVFLCTAVLTFAQAGIGGGGDPVTPIINTLVAITLSAVAGLATLWLIWHILAAGFSGGRLLSSAVTAIGCVFFITHAQAFVAWLAAH